MIITHKIEMDLSRRGVTPRIDAVQGDALTRQIQLELYSNGTAWEIPEGVSALVRFVKPDGTGGIYDTLPDGTTACTTEGNTVSVILAPEVTTVSGAVLLAVTLIHGDAELSSFALTINVQHNPNATVEGGIQNATLAAMVGKAVEAYMKENPVESSGGVKTVNGVEPDENGNVTIEAGTPTDEQVQTALDAYLAENPVSGGGISTTAINLLIEILKVGMFTTNVSGKIDSLEEALRAGSSGDSGGGSGGGTTVADDITVDGGIITIITVGSEVSVADGMMTIL